MCSSNLAFEGLVLRSLRASPLMKPFLMPGGWQESKCMYWKVSVGLKCVRTSRIECLLNRSPLYTHVSKNVISVSEISAVNFIVGWKLFASSVNYFIASLFVFHRKKNVVNVPFPNECFLRALVDDISLNFRRNDVSKRYCHFCSHCGSVSFSRLNGNNYLSR